MRGYRDGTLNDKVFLYAVYSADNTLYCTWAEFMADRAKAQAIEIGGYFKIIERPKDFNYRTLPYYIERNKTEV